jgi:hypothetical protein
MGAIADLANHPSEHPVGGQTSEEERHVPRLVRRVETRSVEVLRPVPIAAGDPSEAVPATQPPPITVTIGRVEITAPPAPPAPAAPAVDRPAPTHLPLAEYLEVRGRR